MKPRMTSRVAEMGVLEAGVRFGVGRRESGSIPPGLMVLVSLFAGACSGSGHPQRPLTSAASVSVGSDHTCAVLTDGTASCWGDNSFGELGDGEQGVPVPEPTAVAGLSDAQAITAGDGFTCALKSDGSVACWGSDIACQIGDRCSPAGKAGPGVPGVSVLVPTTVPGLTAPALAIQASAIDSRSLGFTCALLSDGTITCWGENDLGLSASAAPGIPATLVGGVTDAVGMAIGGTFGCDLRSTGTVECWGLGPLGQPGTDITSYSASPVAVSGLSDVRALVAGWFHVCALRKDGTVACWGDNSSGQLGDGTRTDSPTPVEVSGLTGVASISTTAYATCALLADGSLRCWGMNLAKLTPTAKSGVSNATSVSVAELSACAVVSGGEIRCWGRDEYGQLGDGASRSDSGDLESAPVTVVAPR